MSTPKKSRKKPAIKEAIAEPAAETPRVFKSDNSKAFKNPFAPRAIEIDKSGVSFTHASIAIAATVCFLLGAILCYVIIAK